MKKTMLSVYMLLSMVALTVAEKPIDPDREANTVILDETGVKNLGIETVPVIERGFEETVFAIGRIRAVPSRHAVVSTRIAGRVVALNVIPGDRVEKGEAIVKVESLQPGDPPPTVTLEAPLSGLVTESHIRLGQPIEPAREILDITDLSTVWAVARVPEAEAGRLEEGMKARIRIPAAGGKVFEGELIRFGTMADEEAGTLDAIFRIGNDDFALRPGMRAEFSIVVNTRPGVMAVPVEAVQGDMANRVVYVEDFELPNAFVRAPVVTGERNDRFVEIKRGLFPGDEVVTTGSYFLGFAGGGSGMSLKEALDAAHGHEHAEDGSELTPEERERRAGEEAAAAGHGHGESGPLTLFLGVAVALLLVLLVLSEIARWRDRRSLNLAEEK